MTFQWPWSRKVQKRERPGHLKAFIREVDVHPEQIWWLCRGVFLLIKTFLDSRSLGRTSYGLDNSYWLYLMMLLNVDVEQDFPSSFITFYHWNFRSQLNSRFVATDAYSALQQRCCWPDSRLRTGSGSTSFTQALLRLCGFRLLWFGCLRGPSEKEGGHFDRVDCWTLPLVSFVQRFVDKQFSLARTMYIYIYQYLLCIRFRLVHLHRCQCEA